MTYTLFLEGIEVVPQFIKSITLYTDITSIYITGKITLNNMAAAVFNDVRTGMDVTLLMLDDNKKTYTLFFKLLGFNKIPCNNNIIKDTLIIEVVSSYYFDNIPVTQCHEGSVSDIISSIINTSYKNYFNKIDIENTEDMPRVRYQLGENNLSFIDRMLKYGRIKYLPVYIFPNFDGTLYLKGVYNMSTQSSTYGLTTYTTANDKKSDTDNLYFMTGYRFLTNTSKSASYIKTIFSNDIYVPSNIKLNNYSILSDTEVGNEQSSTMTPPIVKFCGWSQTPEDSYNITSKENFERNLYTYSVVAICKTIHIDTLYSGALVKLYLPKNTVKGKDGYSDVNLGEGEYIIKNCTINLTPTDQSMRLEMIQANYRQSS